MPVETKATEQTAYCCDPIRIAASDVTCDAVAERRESPWMLLGVWLAIFGLAIAAWFGAIWLVARAM